MLAIIVIQDNIIKRLKEIQVISDERRKIPGHPSLEFEQIIIFALVIQEGLIGYAAAHRKIEQFGKKCPSFVGRQIPVILFPSDQRLGMHDMAMKT